MVEFRSDRYGVIHSIFGKTSFETSALQENLAAFIRSVVEYRPEEGVKGRYITRVHISSTMGPGIILDLDAVTEIAEKAD